MDRDTAQRTRYSVKILWWIVVYTELDLIFWLSMLLWLIDNSVCWKSPWYCELNSPNEFRKSAIFLILVVMTSMYSLFAQSSWICLCTVVCGPLRDILMMEFSSCLVVLVPTKTGVFMQCTHTNLQSLPCFLFLFFHLVAVILDSLFYRAQIYVGFIHCLCLLSTVWQRSISLAEK